jgi:hypothetical protein
MQVAIVNTWGSAAPSASAMVIETRARSPKSIENGKLRKNTKAVIGGRRFLRANRSCAEHPRQHVTFLAKPGTPTKKLKYFMPIGA